MIIITIKLDNKIQYKLFITLYQNPKGVNRDFLVKELNIPRTTIYDNLAKLFEKEVNGIPYVCNYSKITNKKGRPSKIFYIPKGIRKNLSNFIIN